MQRFDITIAGEVNLDLIFYGLAEQMPLDRELIANDFRLTLGSSSGILAHNLSTLGMKVGFITRTGSDPLGAIALDRLREAKVDTSRSTSSQQTTTGVTIVLHHGDTRHILTWPGTMAEMSIDDIDIDYLKQSRHFHISSLFLQKRLKPSLPALCRELKSAGLTISLDTNDDPADEWSFPLHELLDTIDILLPNEDEAVRMTFTEDIEEAITRLSKRVPVIAVKRGSRGCTVQSNITGATKRLRIPPLSVVPVDTIGAGDSFNAGFLKGYLQGRPLAECGAMGNATAALSTLRSGGTEAFRDSSLLHEFLAFHNVLD